MKTGLIHSIMLLVLVTCLSNLVVAESADWPRWRGKSMDATVSGAGVFDHDLTQDLKVVWRKPLGSGYSSVSVAQGYAVTLFTDNGDDYAAAFDPETGRELWRYKISQTYKGHDGSHDGPISTPAVANGKMFGLGADGHFFALDLKTGQELWTKHLETDFNSFVPFYGFATAPIVEGNVVILETSGKAGTIVGLDGNSGEQLWTAGSDTSNYHSPIMTQIHGQNQLVCAGNKYIYGIEPASGELLWEFKHDGGSSNIHPVAIGDNRLFIQYKWQESMAFEVKKTEDGYATEELWKNRNIRGTYNPPVYHDGYLFGYSSRFLTCLDATTGETVWKSREPGDGWTILVDGHLVIVTKTGDVAVSKASPEGYQEVMNRHVFDDLAWTPASFANGRIYARSLGEMAAIDITRVDRMASAEQDEEMVLGETFGKFLKEVESASDKQAVVDKFMAAQKEFPIIEDDIVHFLYQGQAKDVVLYGDMVGIEFDQPLTRLAGTNLYYYATRIDPRARLNYGYIVDFDKRTIDSLNTHHGAEPSGEVSYLEMPQYTEPAHLSEPDDVASSRIDTMRFESKIAGNERRIDFYLPPGYDENPDQRYPVIYVHRGERALSFGKMQTSLDNLIGKGVQPLIGVFIYHAPEAGNEYQGDGKDAYCKMVIEELIPYVDENFRTIAKPEARASLGAGWGPGFISVYASFKYPGVFGNVATQSTGLLTANLNELKEVITEEAEKQPLRVYLDWGKYDLRSPVEAWDIRVENQQLARHIGDKGYKVAGGEAPTGYGWASWRTRTHEILKTFFPLN